MRDLKNLMISSTIIVISKDNKALIVQRPANKTFPNLWTVAGGKIQDKDGIIATKNFRYFSAEACAVRELGEETGINFIGVHRLNFLCSVYSGELNRIILSFYTTIKMDADQISIRLSECQDYKWITEDEIKNYNFIIDIGGEIREVFKRLETEKQRTIDRWTT